MTRDEFKAVVKAVSFWKIDKRRGDYQLPSGEWMHDYLHHLIWRLLNDNGWMILSTGNVSEGFLDPYVDDDQKYENQEDRIHAMVVELIGRCMR